jgi:hypothetical protein
MPILQCAGLLAQATRAITVFSGLRFGLSFVIFAAGIDGACPVQGFEQ